MNKVFDIKNLPARRFSARQIISLNRGEQIGSIIKAAKYNLVMGLASSLIEDDRFFSERPDSAGQYTMIEYGIDCIILTVDEVAELKRESFKDGLRHAQGFMEVPNEQS